jgi:hypothetical protein
MLLNDSATIRTDIVQADGAAFPPATETDPILFPFPMFDLEIRGKGWRDYA